MHAPHATFGASTTRMSRVFSPPKMASEESNDGDVSGLWFRKAIFLLFLAILAIFGGRYFHSFLPCWPFLESSVLIISGHFGRIRRAAMSVTSFYLTLERWVGLKKQMVLVSNMGHRQC